MKPAKPSRAWEKYERAIINQEKLEQIGWRKILGRTVPFAGRRLTRRQRHRYKHWGRVAAVNYIKYTADKKGMKQHYGIYT